MFLLTLGVDTGGFIWPFWAQCPRWLSAPVLAWGHLLVPLAQGRTHSSMPLPSLSRRGRRNREVDIGREGDLERTRQGGRHGRRKGGRQR